MSSQPSIPLTIIICTHNPRPEYITRVLTALQHQALSPNDWELLVIDNASDHDLSQELDLTWHPKARCIREETLGLTPARLKGIHEATGETLVFVDDDNVLDPDYLEIALSVGQEWPKLGAWGGQTIAEFAEPPPEWTKPYWGMLAIREFSEDRWSNFFHQYQSTPVGAGLCIRRWIAQKYANTVQHQPERNLLGRTGQQLSAGDDTDLTYTVYDVGWGTGLFTNLKLLHLIPAQRLDEGYLLRLREGLTYSLTILDHLRGNSPNYRRSAWQELRRTYQRLKMTTRERRFEDAVQHGRQKAQQIIKELGGQKSQ
jgi:glycosyltransferase involved in cell wall biosynthesis